MKKVLTLLTLIIFVFACSSFAADKNYTNSIGMEFVLVPAGSFIMGTPSPVCNCPQDDPFTSRNEYKECMNKCTSSVSSNETPAHRVTISKAFYMGKYEVTQEEWYKVMGNNPAYFKSDKVGQDSRRFPVEHVSWNDVQEFVKRLNAKEVGNHYRLPTEAEWEYASKGGQSYEYSGSDSADDVAWYYDNSGNRTHKVGTKKPNGYGLYDMSGNVWEWVQDLYDEKAYSRLSSTDPVNNRSGSDRVNRGGSWGNGAGGLHLALRSGNSGFNSIYGLGFRLLRTVN